MREKKKRTDVNAKPEKLSVGAASAEKPSGAPPMEKH